MHCRTAQQTTPKNKPRKRHHAKNATDRQQTNRQRNRKTDRQTEGQEERRRGQRVIRIRGGHWQHAGRVEYVTTTQLKCLCGRRGKREGRESGKGDLLW